MHQLTTYLVKNFGEIVIEDLAVKNMMANGKLARHIADVGFYEARRQLEYKTEWFGRDLTLSNRTYQCACGNHKCRDFNASINLENYTARSAGIYAAGDNGSALAS